METVQGFSCKMKLQINVFIAFHVTSFWALGSFFIAAENVGLLKEKVWKSLKKIVSI